MKSRDEVSAGGVVYRHAGDGVEVVICKAAGYERWVLPKGLVGRGESYEDAAVREVAEEVGVRGRVVAPLGEPEKYVYTARGVRVFKRVYYFLLEYQSGTVTPQEGEILEARWLPLDEAIETVAYKQVTDVLRRAQVLLSAQTPDEDGVTNAR